MEAIRPADIEPIRLWRNAQIRVLRQSAPISREQQEDYFRTQVWPEMESATPRNILLAYLKGEELVGYGGLVHVAWEHRRAEVSFLLKNDLASTPEEHTFYFPAFLRLMKALAFHDLRLDRLCTETYAIRPQFIQALEREGFRREGTLRHHVRIDGKPVDAILHGCLRSET
ncbi:MAG TPA: GNAT family N-acetyltransferase [Burkholderiales bacterium]|nr:GNAT family N-acetyltransferase [Burkholderiales bacterium]